MSLKIGSNQISPIQVVNNINNQSNKTVTPTKSAQTIRQDTGYDGLTQVTVNSIPASYIIPTGTLTITNSGTVNASQYASVSIPGMANPTWTTATITSNAAKVVYSINLTSGFKSVSQSFSSSYTLPSVAGTTITPTTTAQTAVAQYKWTTGSVIVDAIPISVGVYKKIVERTITIPELNSFFSSQTIVPSYTFINAQNLDGSVNGVLNFSNITDIKSYAFSGCSKLTHISGPNVTTLGSCAFSGCSKLISANFPNVTTMGAGAFSYCLSLTTVSMPKLLQILSSGFDSCHALLSVNFPSVSLISGNYVFYQCYSMSIVSLPLLTLISGSYTFQQCSLLNNIYFPCLSGIRGSNVFGSCIGLETISLPSLNIISGGSIFNNCSNLKSVYLMSTSIVSLANSTAFNNSPIYSSSYLGYFASIYVPNSLLASYKAATNWSYYSERFVGI